MPKVFAQTFLAGSIKLCLQNPQKFKSAEILHVWQQKCFLPREACKPINFEIF